MIIDIEKGYDAFITAYPFDFCISENLKRNIQEGFHSKIFLIVIAKQ